MNKLMRYLGSAGLALAVVMAPVQAATQKKKTAASSSHVTPKATPKATPSKSKVAAVPKAKAATAPKAKTKGVVAPLSKTHSDNKPSAVASADKAPVSASSCKVIRSRRGKRVRTCASDEPVLQSPIQGNALNSSAPADKTPEIKARTAPDRAYAVDGETFFYQGRKYRIAGLKAQDGSSMATQRLQKTLESGALSVEPVGGDDGGVATATVRINGRDIVDQLR